MSDQTHKEATTASGEAPDLDQLSEDLSGANRRKRQDASHELARIAREQPELLAAEAEAEALACALVDALYRPEAQTRWESMDALFELAATRPELVASAYEGAEASLFDEGSARVRIAAFRLLARLGASSAEQSDKVWPILDEAIQCYHGDQGYRDMLTTLLELAQGKASAETKAALAERVGFDAESGRGYVKTISADIVQAAQGK